MINFRFIIICFRFLKWLYNSVESLVNPIAIKALQSFTLVANFIKQWLVTTSVNGAGTITPSSGLKDEGNITIEVTVTNPLVDEFEKIEITPDGEATQTFFTSTLVWFTDKATVIVGYVKAIITYWTLTVTKEGNGTVNPDVGDHQIPEGSNVITATPDTDNEFIEFVDDTIPTTNNPYTYVINGIKSILARFGYLVPFYSDAVEYWDGTVIDVTGTKYFKGKKGVADLLITGYDFDTDWTKGFPYKTAATVSAPAGNATLIASDLNNFFYTGGIPNQIPVVSFFENVDYAGKIFCLHNAQQVVSVPIETHITGVFEDYDMEVVQPSVQKIVLYNTVKTGADLTTVNNYFSVPTKQASNIREVGSGKTYATISAAITAATAGDRIYIYSGKYVENVTCSKANITFYGLGNVVLQPTVSQSYTIQLYANGITLEGLNIIPNTTTEGLTCNGLNLTINKCYFSRVSIQRTIWYRGAGNITITNTISLGGALFTNTLTGNVFINDSYFTNTSDYILNIASFPTIASLSNYICKHSKLINSVGTQTIYNHGAYVLILDNEFIYNTFNSITSQAYLSPSIYEIILNRVTASSGHCFHSFSKFCNNEINIAGLGAGSDGQILVTVGAQTIRILLDDDEKHINTDIYFINKYGCQQTVSMRKQRKESIAITGEKYQGFGQQPSDSYHQFTDFNINGKTNIQLSSGFIPESSNSSIKELLLSEKIWMLYNGTTIPVNLKSKSLEFKTRINDQLINYVLDFEYSYNEINNV